MSLCKHSLFRKNVSVAEIRSVAFSVSQTGRVGGVRVATGGFVKGRGRYTALNPVSLILHCSQ